MAFDVNQQSKQSANQSNKINRTVKPDMANGFDDGGDSITRFSRNTKYNNHGRSMI
jgi:hypothetical protein